MADFDMAVEREESGGPGPVFLGLSTLSLFIIAAVALFTLAPAFQHQARAAGRKPARTSRTTSPPVARDRHAATVIYMVESESEAVPLRLALEEWDQAIREGGLEVAPLRRIVVSEGPEDVLARRIFDFSFIGAGAAGDEVRVVDLRN